MIMENKIKAILGNNIQFTPTNLGLTNNIYKGKIGFENVAIRIPKEETKELSAFNNEKNVLPLIKDLDLDVPEIYYDPETRVRITRWIPNAIEYKLCPDEDKIERVAKILKKFHGANLKSGVDFNCVALLNEYRSHIKDLLHPLDDYYHLISDIQQIHNEHILCHNDLVSGNLLFTKEKDYLIDYEYAKDNDPLFDIMSFFTENKITDSNLRNRFYAAYFDSPLTPIQIKQLSIYESFHNLLWCTWANMMYDLLHEEIYLEIASDKYNALKISVQ